MSEAPLTGAVRARVVGLAADALGRMDVQQLPLSLRRVASFAPARRARLAANQISAALAEDDDFRERLAVQVRAGVPDLVRALAGDGGSPADPVDLAAVAYLLRPEGWTEVLDAAAATDERAITDDGRADRLGRRLQETAEQLQETRRRHRDRLAELKEQNADLRLKLGQTRSRARAAEAEAEALSAAADQAVSAAQARSSAQEAELRRLRARIDQLEREVATLRRVERNGRGTETLRARLLLDTLLDTAQGLRRELALPAGGGSPADAVEAMVAEHGTRASSGHASLAADDPALLDQLLALPRVHLVVDGYNVTKTAWPELPLERQRDRLLGGLAPVAARSGAEVTVVFDAAGATERPLVNRPRGVRVLFSSPGVIADDVIRDLVGAEPPGRPVVVVSSDAEVVRDVLAAGARTASAGALSRLLARS